MAKPPVIEDKQVEHLIKATAAYSRVPLRDTALLLTLYGTALSVTELATIAVGDYLDANGSVRVTSAVRVDVAHSGEERPLFWSNRRVQRLVADELSNASFNAIQAAQDLYRALYAGSLPAGDRFKFGQHVVEAVAQVGQHVISVTREAMRCMDSRGSAANQHGVRQDVLEPSCGGQDKLPVRLQCGVLRHSEARSDGVGRRDRKRGGDTHARLCQAGRGPPRPPGAEQPNPATDRVRSRRQWQRG